MKARIFILTLLILAVCLNTAVPAWAQQAQAYASILIVIPPAEDEVKTEVKEETREPEGQLILVREDSQTSEEEE